MIVSLLALAAYSIYHTSDDVKFSDDDNDDDWDDDDDDDDDVN